MGEIMGEENTDGIHSEVNLQRKLVHCIRSVKHEIFQEAFLSYSEISFILGKYNFIRKSCLPQEIENSSLECVRGK